MDQSSLGQPLAQVVTDFLKELNDSVEGTFVEESPAELVRNNPAFFKDFQLVVASQVCFPPPADYTAKCLAYNSSPSAQIVLHSALPLSKACPSSC